MPVFIFRNFFLEALAVLKYAQRFSTQSSAIFDDKICANPMKQILISCCAKVLAFLLV